MALPLLCQRVSPAARRQPAKQEVEAINKIQRIITGLVLALSLAALPALAVETSHSIPAAPPEQTPSAPDLTSQPGTKPAPPRQTPG